MPTRLIDVSEKRPVLVDTSTLISPVPYTALSHCWGQGHHPLSSTTSRTLQDFQNGIDLFDLPKTFRDAAEITRRLNLKYLWIDSLCIIQDSKEDWEREAQEMGIYYQNCFLNISALDAPESDTGFLQPRPVTPTVHIQDNLYLRPATRSWRNVFQSSPLGRRAWVLQERLVCTRVLHYGRDDMFWECLTCSTRESNISEHTSTDQNAIWEDEGFKRSLQFSEKELVLRRTEALRKWYRVVMQYSALRMSHESDMLPAISAIAKRVQTAMVLPAWSQHKGPVTGFRYIAGMWEEHLHTGLLWYADGSKIRSTIWRAPSWSWAQLTGPVRQMYSSTSIRQTHPNDVEVIDVDVTPATSTDFTKTVVLSSGSDTLFKIVDSTSGDALGTVVSAQLVVQGLMTSVWIKGSHGNPPYNNPSLKLILDIFNNQGLPVGTGYLDMLVDDKPTMPCVALAISARRDFYSKKATQLPITYFLLLEEVLEVEEFRDTPPLLTSTNSGSRKYKRIGIGQTFDPFQGVHFDTDLFQESQREEIVLV